MKAINHFILLPFLPLGLLAAALFAPMLVQGRALFWGTPLLQFVPWWSFAWSTLLEGHLPLWDPLVGMGAPLLANYQSALFYPPHWIYLLLFAIGDSPLMAWGQGIMVAMHLLWASIGMVYLIRRLGLGVLSQVIGGLAFGFCGYLIARASFLSINAAVSWLPWILLCLTPRVLGERISNRRLSFLVVCLSFQLLSGHAQTTWYTLVLAVLWSGFWGWQSAATEDPSSNITNNLKALGSAWGKLLLALLLAILIAAIQLIPTAEYLIQSQRAQAVDFDLAMSYSFWPWRLIELVAPGFYGHPAQGDYWGYANYWEDALYIGMLPILLVISALVGNFRRNETHPHVEDSSHPVVLTPRIRQSLIWFLLAILIASLVLSLGRNTPLFPWLYRNIPTFDLFQAPTRMMIWAEFALVMLAALGADDWRRPEGRGLYWTRLGTTGAFAVTIGAAAAWYILRDISPTFLRATALAGLWGLLAGLLSLVAPSCENGTTDTNGNLSVQNLWHWSVALFVALDLFVAAWGANPSVDLDLYRQSPNDEVVNELTAGHRLFLPMEDEEYIKFKRFLRFDTFHPEENWVNLRAVMLPNTPILDGIRSANNFDPLLPGRFTRWINSLESAGTDLHTQLLDLMDVRVIERLDQSTRMGVEFELLEGGQRVRWATCMTEVTTPDKAWALVMSGEVDFQSNVVLESDRDGSIPEAQGDCVDDSSNTPAISLQESGPNKLDISVQALNDGWIVLSDVWYPGWRAWVDGQPVRIYHANYLFRAVYVGAGEHVIEFRYQPISFWLGACISIVGICLLAILWHRFRSSHG